MGERYPRLRLRGIPEGRVLREGQPYRPRRQLLAREVFRIVFYLPHDHSDLAPAVSQALARYLSAVGEGPKSIRDVSISYDEGGALTPERWDLVRRLLQDTRPWSYPKDYEPWEQREIEKRRFERGLLFTGGFGIRNGYEFEYKARIPSRPTLSNTAVSVLTATVPVDYLEERGPEQVRQLVLDIAAPLPFASGHAGLALKPYGPLPFTDAVFRTELLRYPGIDLREAWGFLERMGPHVDGVHWLNFLGAPLIVQLGGASTLRAQLHSAATTVVSLDGARALVALGERPESGDSVIGERLPAYDELAQRLTPMLEPITIDKHLARSHALPQSNTNETQRLRRRLLE